MTNKIIHLTLMGVLWCASALIFAQSSIADDAGFDNRSFYGAYASTGIGRGGVAPVAGLTMITANGKGTFYGTATVNRPAVKNGERKVLRFPIKGQYHVAKDGSGTLKLIPPQDIGEPQSGHFLITDAYTDRKTKKRIATEISFILDELLPNAMALQTSVIKRLPRRGGFNNASLSGTYASTGIGRGGESPVAGISMIKADGKGRLVGRTIINRPNGKDGTRHVVTFPIKGWYRINSDGSGTVKIFPPEDIGEPQSGQLMATQSRVKRNGKWQLITGMSFVLDELLPNAAALQTSEMKRREN